LTVSRHARLEHLDLFLRLQTLQLMRSREFSIFSFLDSSRSRSCVLRLNAKQIDTTAFSFASSLVLSALLHTLGFRSLGSLSSYGLIQASAEAQSSDATCEHMTQITLVLPLRL
jgi:3-methyladenine DNA glycosylase Tag